MANDESMPSRSSSKQYPQGHPATCLSTSFADWLLLWLAVGIPAVYHANIRQILFPASCFVVKTHLSALYCAAHKSILVRSPPPYLMDSLYPHVYIGSFDTIIPPARSFVTRLSR